MLFEAKAEFARFDMTAAYGFQHVEGYIGVGLMEEQRRQASTFVCCMRQPD